MPGMPKIASYDDFDVLQGKTEASREEWKRGTFHDSEMNGDDVIFGKKALLMGGSASTLELDATFSETSGDKKAKAITKTEAVAADNLEAIKI